MSVSESESAVTNRGNAVEDDCPLCLEPLPPFWDVDRRVSLICCGNIVCVDCRDKESEYLDRAAAEGSWGKAEEQLRGFCSLCRAENPPNSNCVGKIMETKFGEGRLPLNMYWQLGNCYLTGDRGMEVDVERGIEILMLGAEKGDPNCQYFLGRAYRDERFGLQKYVEDAKRWYLAATEQGHAPAEFYLAHLFKGDGNDAEYLQYLKGSASKGYDDACYNLGHSYYYGFRGAQQSFEEAIRVLTPAAQRGDAGCMNLLGICMVY